MKKTILLEILILLIITIPAFLSIFNNQYFTMHDNQHVARLYLLDHGIKQGELFPRWVDLLGFNYGYPLFNFYPPLVYYISEAFHLLGFSLIWSMKLTFMLGFFLSSLGIYLFVSKLLDKKIAFVAAVFYTYFLYHALNIYVRGALAEFFSMSILPFTFLSINNLGHKINIRNSIFFGTTFALLILTHPLIAFPSTIFIFLFIAYYFLITKNKILLLKHFFLGGLVGLSLSAFFWLPSILEKRHTLVDDILTKQLANYKIHYVYLKQFINSPWGYGGSVEGPIDGLSFQLGKIYIFLSIFSILLAFIYLVRKKNIDKHAKHFFFMIFLLLFSLFMTTKYSSFLWDNIKYLWYLQFPWRFLTFTSFFISVIAAYFIFFLREITKNILNKSIVNIFTILLCLITILTYQKYFKPQKLINTDDVLLTSFNEIAWNISKSSFEFIPKGVKTTQSELKTTVPAIGFDSLPKSIYEIISGKAEVQIIQNKFAEKKIRIKANSKTKLQLNVFNFPGWKAYLNNNLIQINDTNDLKLITVDIPKGEYILRILFENTGIRTFANLISIFSLMTVLALLLKLHFVNSRK